MNIENNPQEKYNSPDDFSKLNVEDFLELKLISYPNQTEIAPFLERFKEDKNWKKDKEFTGKIREYLKSQFQYWIDRSKKPAKDSDNYKNIYEEELTKLLIDLDN